MSDTILQNLISEIESAFEGVVLEDGISLHMTEYLDSYGLEERFLQLAEHDERFDWKKITDTDLERCNCVFAFCEWKGFRFFLPACLRWILKNPHSDNAMSDSLFFHVSPKVILDSYHKQITEILTTRQIQGIVAVLQYCLNHLPEYQGDETLELNLQDLKTVLSGEKGWWQS